MREDLLTELHLPEIDVKCLQKVVTQNTTRLVNLLREHDEYLKKSKINLPGCNGQFAVSVVKNFTECQVNGQLVLQKKKLLNGSNKPKMGTEDEENKSLVNGLREEGCAEDKKSEDNTRSTTLASDLGWGSNDEEDDEVPETRPRPTRFNMKQDIPISWEMNLNVDESSEMDYNIESGTEFLRGFTATSMQEEQHTETPPVPFLSSLKTVESNSDSMPITTSAKPMRCYFRKKNKLKVKSVSADEVKNIELGVGGSIEDMEKENEEEDKPFCVIAEVFGNADEAFSGAEASEGIVEASEAQLITPKKTNDITKIKGWRRKQFLVEKPTTVEFYTNGPTGEEKIEVKSVAGQSKEAEHVQEKPENVQNAFVCDSLDDFLDREAELNITYEIPHLYAEVGIKLTKEDVVSGPNLSQEDFKKVESRYCVPVPQDSKPKVKVEVEDTKKGVKRQIEEEVKVCKILKVEENRRRSVRIVNKQLDQRVSLLKQVDCKKTTEETSTGNMLEAFKKPKENINNINLTSKLIGMVVYPCPFRPLHPLVRNHLDKIRSYRTKIDKNWATFAVSAVRIKWRNRQAARRILPVLCCGKVVNPRTTKDVKPEVKEVVDNLIDSVCKNVEPIEKKVTKCEIQVKTTTQINQGVSLLKNSIKKEIQLKECRVVINKINSLEPTEVWCVEHGCWSCQLDHSETSKSVPDIEKKELKEEEEEEEEIQVIDEPPKAMSVSLQTPFDEKITNLLTKKLRTVRLSGDTLTSIDSLKTLRPNGIELIKLNFVKQSFLTGYVNIWYLKPEVSQKKSRVFLTFEKTPPLRKAINLKSSKFCVNNLPKIIMDIVSEKDVFDVNEYAILHCNGEQWEIYGSLNFGVKCKESEEGKPEEEVEQVFTPVPLPELVKLQKIAMQILKVKSVKWWVLDLSQKFSELCLKTDTRVVTVSRKDILDYVDSQVYGFVTLTIDDKERIYGAYIGKKTLPYILIGPFFLLEAKGLYVKLGSSTIPFTYQGVEDPNLKHPLKVFINSVVMGLKGSEKKLSGLWLYDKMFKDETCYLEVITTNPDMVPIKDCIEIEHGYSLNSRSSSSKSEPSPGVEQRKEVKGSQKAVTVYLYFEVFELGYVTGELHPDNAVTIQHPLTNSWKVKSYKIGDWFVRIIKRRIRFIPKDLNLRWFITKHFEDLRDRQPFDKLCLGGAHILCKNGLFYLLKMTDEKIKELGLDKSEVLSAISESKVINEVAELNHLEEVVAGTAIRNLSMERVLALATKEIAYQKKLEESLMDKKRRAKMRKLKLGFIFLELLDSFNINVELKVKFFEKVKDVFMIVPGSLNENFVHILEKYEFGRKYLEKTNESGNKECSKEEKKDVGEDEEKDVVEEEEVLLEKEEKVEKVEKIEETLEEDKAEVTKCQGSKEPKTNDSVLEKLEAKLSNVYSMLDTNGSSPNSLEYRQLLEKLNSISDQLNSIKNIIHDVSKVKGKSEQKESKLESEPKMPTNVKGGFVKLNSSQLPKNIRLVPEQELMPKEKSRVVQQTSLLKNKETRPRRGNSEGQAERKDGQPGSIVIIKNFRNNKTALHRIQIPSCRTKKISNETAAEAGKFSEKVVDTWKLVPEVVLTEFEGQVTSEKKNSQEGNVGNSYKTDESDIR